MNRKAERLRRVALCVLNVTLAWSAPAADATTRASQSLQYNFHWQQTESTVSLLNGTQTVWQGNYRKEPGKPSFHPVALTDGTVLTGFRPADHTWQRALFFSWKYINHVNYWEEDKEGNSDGVTELVSASAQTASDFSARIEMDLAYHPPGQPAVLKEKRRIHVLPPDAEGCYRIDWQSEFTAGAEEVHLDRTPPLGQPDGKPWGGYAGLTTRFAGTIRDWQINNSESGVGKEVTNGKPARWYDISGDFRGDGNEHHWAGITMFDHPASMRHPTPWQVNTSDEIHFVAYMPSFLFHTPYTIPAGGKVLLRHRVLIHPGLLDKSKIEQEWRSYSVTSE